MTPNRSPRGDVFFAVGDANRRRILELLAGEDRPVGVLAAELGIAQPSVSQHLVVLRDVGLVEATRVGTSSVYRLVSEPLDEVTQWIASLGTAAD